jgi:hypothetical protein
LEDCTPSHAQAIKMRKFADEGRLNEDVKVIQFQVVFFQNIYKVILLFLFRWRKMR